jgi:superfamily II DNA or RNA helicase
MGTMTVDPIEIPSKFWFSKVLGKNYLRQLRFPALALGAGDSEKSLWVPGAAVDLNGRKILISKRRLAEVPSGFDDVLCVSDAGEFEWSKKNEIADLKWQAAFERREAVAAGLRGRFKFIEEERNPDLSVRTAGLRSPQIGAIHAALAHWRMSSDVATIVLPTGTGKTDSMVALMALLQPKCLLVVVPTDALRTQLAEKFMSFGVLVEFGLLPPNTVYPVVGVLRSGFEGPAEIKVFCDACNVIVTTMPLLGGFSELDQETIATCCSCLFIDEAHHVKAVTWSRVRSRFEGKPILQFTATPYRNDGQHVDGRIIFNYPLRKAQEEGYFRRIQLRELWDYVEIEEAVAKVAVDQLVADLSRGLDHIVMARAASIERAEDLKAIYDALAGDLSPVVVHSHLSRRELKARMDRLYRRESRIAICVSMFGEGFDFPELKIAALHDIHQSLAVTIQFTGRFTRSNPNVGDATIIVNRAVSEVDDSVRELYAQGGGADWNHILTRLTQGATERQISKETFYDSFSSDSSVVAIQNVTPKMSTVVYRTSLAKWTPWKIDQLPIAEHIMGDISVSIPENTAFFVTLINEAVDWADSADLVNRTYDLYALFWDAQTKLLYINSSDNEAVHEELARGVGGDDAELISGPDAFRVLHGIRRLLLRNMGMNDRRRRSVRFMMYTGSDIEAYLESSQTYGKEKTHVFGDGFDGTSRVTIGTSRKGRIWSWQEAKDLLEWKKWCVGVGAKLIDTTIEPDSYLKDSMVPRDISGPPDLYPLTVEWPDELYHRSEESVFVDDGTSKVPFFEVGIDLIEPAPGSPLRFRVFTEDFSSSYRLRFSENSVTYVPEAEDLSIKIGKKMRKLSEFFGLAHPIVRYEKDSMSRGDQLLEPRLRRFYTFNVDKILTWGWEGVDLTKESQTIHKRKDSIQYRTIQTVGAVGWDRNYEVIFDDDAPGEAADVICMAISGGKLVVDLFHCKYTKAEPGSRTKDLYEVCGQAQRSIKWRDDVERLLVHMVNREKKRKKNHDVSRFERGDFKHLQGIRGEARSLVPEFRIFIVQPGVSKASVTDDQRELLGSTEMYLHETLGIEFKVVASE